MYGYYYYVWLLLLCMVTTTMYGYYYYVCMVLWFYNLRYWDMGIILYLLKYYCDSGGTAILIAVLSLIVP